jgi:DNA-directed RNA polymerase specialized sigma24 family protein
LADTVSKLDGRDDDLSDAAIDLIEALAQLGEQQRRCVALVDIAGLTAPQAAAILGITAATVRGQLRAARRHLRGLLCNGDRSSSGDSTQSRCRADPQGFVEPEELLG